MKNKAPVILAIFSFCILIAQAQITQTIRGKVLDKESQTEIIGANVFLTSDSTQKIAATTDVSGSFRLSNVPVGRHSIKVTFIGYNEVLLQNLIVDAGKELILNILMEEMVNTMDEVEITANKKGETNNDMSTVSNKSFSMEQTDRYAGSRSDPARMASNFAGVNGANDSRNDIVIRGNSPMGLLWRVEGIDIPNPNHFAIPGTTGGAISILNNKIFGVSDFYTGAFPAEYGNANAGVFDIKLRNGNNEKFEFTGQLGFLGTELAGEGPINKSKGSSFLFTYRYSTLKLFESFNFKIGTSAVPAYQDASFKLNFPTKKSGIFSIWAIGGTSNINIMLSDKTVDEVELYGDNNRDQYFKTSMGVGGFTHTKSVNDKSYVKTTLAFYASSALADHDIFYRDTVSFLVDTVFAKMRYRYVSNKASLNHAFTHKFSAKHSIKTGLLADAIFYNMIDSNLFESANEWQVRNNIAGNTFLIQPYFQWKYKPNNNLTVNAGLHAQYFALSNSFSAEPRAGVKWQLKNNQALSFGTGMHSQVQPLYIYLNQQKNANGEYVLHNKNLDFTRAIHSVLGYERGLGKNTRMVLETYYQYLYNIPVDNFSSAFSLVNQGSTFSRFFPDTLVNSGTGFNYGMELTIEKFFSKQYYFLFTASFYESKYKGSDKVLRSTDYNGRYVLNGLFGKEFKLGNSGNKTLSTGTKITWAGGKLYTPADLAASKLAGELIEIDSLRNTVRSANYFRLDFKIGFKVNTKKLTHELAIDLVNVLNNKNVLGITYAPDPKNPTASPIREEYQLGFLPLFYYKLDF